MSARVQWAVVMRSLAGAGWSAAVVDAARLADLRVRVATALDSCGLSETAAARLREKVAFELPESPGPARSVIVGALARPLTQATLTVDGGPRTVQVPPHYAGYFTLPGEFTRAAGAALAAFGHRAAGFAPPLKTLAACAGLARYGRNTIAYVPGLGSYLILAACVTDASPPEDAPWTEPLPLARCEGCRACLRACPTGAIRADRFALATERCLTFVNEDLAPFPEWVDPAWHGCAVGCLRCQQACPENAEVDLIVDPPEVFDGEESAAILAANGRASPAPTTFAKLQRCGLDFSPDVIARNLRVLIGG